MPGYKTPKQDKKKPKMEMSRELTEAGDVADGTAQKMEQYKKMPQKRKMAQDKKMMQDKKVMQPRRSGIYMDRKDGVLPQDRVAKYYQETNPKMEQLSTLKDIGSQILEGFKFGGREFKRELGEVGEALKEYYNKGKQFVKQLDKNMQPTSNFEKRGSRGTGNVYQDKKYKK